MAKKEKCPACGKTFTRLSTHMTKMHEFHQLCELAEQGGADGGRGHQGSFVTVVASTP